MILIVPLFCEKKTGHPDPICSILVNTNERNFYFSLFIDSEANEYSLEGYRTGKVSSGGPNEQG